MPLVQIMILLATEFLPSCYKSPKNESRKSQPNKKGTRRKWRNVIPLLLVRARDWSLLSGHHRDPQYRLRRLHRSGLQRRRHEAAQPSTPCGHVNLFVPGVPALPHQIPSILPLFNDFFSVLDTNAALKQRILQKVKKASVALFAVSLLLHLPFPVVNDIMSSFATENLTLWTLRGSTPFYLNMVNWHFISMPLFLRDFAFLLSQQAYILIVILCIALAEALSFCFARGFRQHFWGQKGHPSFKVDSLYLKQRMENWAV